MLRAPQFSVAISLTTMMLLHNHVFAAPLTWDGSCMTTHWSGTCPPGMTNWNPDVIPGGGDDVTIPPGSTVQTIADSSCATLASQGQLNLVGTLTVGNGGTISGGLSVNTVGVGLKILGNALQLTGTGGWPGGGLAGPGFFVNSGNLAGNAVTQSANSKFVNNSTCTMSGWATAPGTQLTNAAGGEFTIDPTFISGGISGTGGLTNSGTFTTQHDDRSSIVISPTFNQDAGEFRIAGFSSGEGTRLDRGGTFSGGTISISDNATLTFANPGGGGIPFVFNGAGPINGDGNVAVASGNSDWRVENDLSLDLIGNEGFVFQSVNLTLLAELTNEGLFQWLSGTIREEDCGLCLPALNNKEFFEMNGSLLLDTTLSNHAGGTMQQLSGSLTLTNLNGLLTNLGTYDLIAGNISKQFPTDTDAVIGNYGLFRKPFLPQTQDSQISVRFVHGQGGQMIAASDHLAFVQGSLQLEGGSIEIQSEGIVELAGGVHVAEPGSTTEVTGTGYFDNLLGGAGSGLYAKSGSVVVFELDDDDNNGLRLAGGRFGGPGQIRNVDEMRWTAGGLGMSSPGSGGPLTADFVNEGDCRITGGLVEGAGSIFRNDADGAVFQTTGSFNISGGTVINQNLWVTGPNSVNLIGSGEFVNQDEFVVAHVDEERDDAADITTVSVRFNNLKKVIVDSGTLSFTGIVEQLAPDGTLTGGEWLVDEGATLEFPGFHSIKKIGPNATVLAIGNVPDLQGLTENNGNLTVHDQRLDDSLLNNGDLHLVPPIIFEDPPSIETPGEVENSVLGFMETPIAPAIAGGIAGGPLPFALVCQALNNDGVIAPGGTDLAGTFSMQGDFNQSKSGRIFIEIGGAAPIAEHDQMIVDGDVALSGSAIVKLLDGFVPAVGQQFEIITLTEGGGTVAGTFDEILPAGMFTASYSSQSVKLTFQQLTEPADLDGDGVVGGIDLAMLLGAWTGAAAYIPCPPTVPTDLNGDCRINGMDLALLLGAWR